VEEVVGDDALGLGGEELASGRPGTLRGEIGAGGVQDLPDHGRGDCVAQAGEFALYPPAAPAPVLPGQTQDELLDDGRGGGAAGATALSEGPLTGEELTVPAQQCGGGDREDLAPAVARDQPGECSEPDPVGRLV
jgi:hypothetical protein